VEPWMERERERERQRERREREKRGGGSVEGGGWRRRLEGREQVVTGSRVETSATTVPRPTAAPRHEVRG
jgi:hypothetical protein